MREKSTVLVIPVCLSIAFFGGALDIESVEFDMSTIVTTPYGAGPGGVAPVEVGYHNAGPDTAQNAWIWASIPSGVPAPLTSMTPAQWNALQASVVPDGLGNTAVLYMNYLNCDQLLFQFESELGIGGEPMVGLDPGVGDSISYALEMPMEPPGFAALIIEEPADLAAEYKPVSGNEMWLVASDWGRFGLGNCEAAPFDCSDLSTCFGPRLSMTDPIAGEFELVDDGSADPTWGCLPLIGYTSGNIAVIDRGGCQFGTKALNAQDAGATAVIFVNDGRCVDPNPDSPMCAINMARGGDGHLVTVPVLLLSVNDGGPIIDALIAATPVTGRLGAVSGTFSLDSEVVHNVGVTDLDPTNNISSTEVVFGVIFADGFESGNTTAWSNVAP